MSMQSHSEAAPLDGNAAAGLLGEIFAIEITSATITCDGCGASAQVGEARRTHDHARRTDIGRADARYAGGSRAFRAFAAGLTHRTAPIAIARMPPTE
jgi:hypothetical protein